MTGLASGLRSQWTVQVRLVRGARPAVADPRSGWARTLRRWRWTGCRTAGAGSV